jgi:hypothetical protein
MKKESGQTLMIILLIMVVGLTVGLFLMSRTTTDISLTTKVTDSSRAFNAAEAGIEEAILHSNAGPGTLSTGVTYTPLVTDLGTGGIYPLLPQEFKVGEVFTIWLAGHDVNGNFDPSVTPYNAANIDICFNKISTDYPALAVSLYYSEGGTIKSSSFIVDSNSPKCTNCISPTANVCPGYDYGISNLKIKNSNASDPLGVIGNVTRYALRLRPILANSEIAVKPSGNLPAQGTDISSTGNAGETARKINVKNPFPVPPPFMDYAVYSYGDLSK